MRWSSTTRSARAAALTALVVLLGGCGLAVQSADLFLLTRSGPGGTISMLVTDAGTISCDRGEPKALSDPALIAARDLAVNLDNDAKAGLRLRAAPGTVYTYTVKLQDGTISFPDTSAAKHTELGPLEQFALQQADGPCAAANRS